MNSEERMRDVTKAIFEQTAAAVQAGPFEGMTLLEETSWYGGNILQKLLGVYECELHEEIERVIATKPDLIINIGCAEGYYAVGFAMRLPLSIVHAFDQDPVALRICERSAVANRAEQNLRLEAVATKGAIIGILSASKRAALLVDCEGCERKLFEEIPNGVIEGSAIIIECHDFADAGVTEYLRNKLSKTHDVKLIPQGGRNPNEISFLKHYPEDIRWLAMSEDRPVPMHWLCAHPKTSTGR